MECVLGMEVHMLERDLVLNNVSKRYGDKLVVNSVYLKIEKGDFLTILGPSGGGKTTVLKMVSGFESITEGNVYMDGENINSIPAQAVVGWTAAESGFSPFDCF